MDSSHRFGNATDRLKKLENSNLYQPASRSSNILFTCLASAVIYLVLIYLKYTRLSMSDFAWNFLVYLTPSAVLSTLDKTEDLFPNIAEGIKKGPGSQMLAYKSEAMKRIFGRDRGDSTNKAQHSSFSRIGNFISRRPSSGQTRGPPGLGNWDNSCYQNSIIQGLASLSSLSAFLNSYDPSQDSNSTTEALKNTIGKLNDPANAGKTLWTPGELKSMSSFQQQDAQEYFSKVLDEVDKEMSKSARESPNRGGLADVAILDKAAAGPLGDSKADQRNLLNSQLENSTQTTDRLPDDLTSNLASNPLEGLLAQRVGCLRCDYVEGLSLIPFNCLTVPLGKQWIYDVRTCLDAYTALEPISGVECAKCTLLRTHNKLLSLTVNSRLGTSGSRLSKALKKSVRDRFSAVNKALNDKDFSDSTLLNKCHIPAGSRVSSTKSRQAVIARAPRSLAIHINRSVFDEVTGLQLKNSADVHFPLQLDLAPWCLGNQNACPNEGVQIESWNVDPSKSMISPQREDEIPPEDNTAVETHYMYNLRAVITHYGRHENGHYICYRKPLLHPKDSLSPTSESEEFWWRLSDEEVTRVTEETVLAQGGVFMLFYERAKPIVFGPACRAPLPDRIMSSVELSSESIRADPDLEQVVDNKNSSSQVPAASSLSTDTNSKSGSTEEQISELILQLEGGKGSLAWEPEPLTETFTTASENLSSTETTESPTISTSPSSTSLSTLETISQDESSQTGPPLPNESILEKSIGEESSKYQTSPENFQREPHSPDSTVVPSAPSPSSSSQARFINDSPLTPPTPDAEASPIKDLEDSPDKTSECAIDLNPAPSSKLDSPKGDLKESQRPTSPLMRTSGPRNGRGSVGRASKTMDNISSMVTAN